MGQERSWKGKHFLLCLACCVSIFLGFCACVHSLGQWQGEHELREAKHLMSTGHYSASEKKTLSVLETFPQTLGDEALFQMGLLYSLPKNPNADYEKSKAFFEKILTLHPDSKRNQEAAAWFFVLTRMVENENENFELQKNPTSELQKKQAFELQKRVRVIEQTSEAREKKLKQLQAELEAREAELEAREKEIIENRHAVSQLQSRVAELESQLAEFKNIDLTIEQKKRATAP